MRFAKATFVICPGDIYSTSINTENFDQEIIIDPTFLDFLAIVTKGLFLSVTCYMLHALWRFLSETCYYLQKIVSFRSLLYVL